MTLRIVRSVCFILATGIVAAAPPSSFAAGTAIDLAAHRAIYEIKLDTTRANRQLTAVRGRILYDFSGTACAGYALQFRLVTIFDSGEGKTALSDLRSTTWEDADGKLYRFSTRNFLDEKPTETVDGKATLRDRTIAIALSKPASKTVKINSAAVFPSEHMRRIIAAARAGQTILPLPVYDGTDNGEKIYQTLTVIGAPISPDKKPDDIAAKEPSLAGLTRWPVRISYFDGDKKKEDTGEQTPLYSYSFELYENGISRALKLDYGDFVLAGALSSLELKHEKPCR